MHRFLGLAGFLALGALPAQQLERIPEMTVLLLPVSGGYGQHAARIGEIEAAAAREYQVAGSTFGIYPRDPATTPESALIWSLAVPVKGERFAAPKAPFHLTRLPAAEALVLETTAARLAETGPAVTAWLTKHGYRPAGDARTEYGKNSTNPAEVRARFILPVRRDAPDTKGAAAH
jgi:hypothetical protein